MKKFIPAITLIALIGIQAPVHAAWASKKKPKPCEEGAQPKTPGFNQHDDRSAFIEADYLFWRPQLEDSRFVVKNTQSTESGETNNKFTLKQPSYDISSGVRFGIGGYTPDSWDVGLKATYLYADATKRVGAKTDQQAQLKPQWVPSVFGSPASKANARWQLNLFILDFAIGREFFLTNRFAIHPFIGLRGYDINQKIHDKYVGLFDQGSQTTPTQASLSGKFRAHQNIWGIGPRLGIDLNFYVHTNWAFLGGLSGSLLYSDSKVKEKFLGHQSASTGGGTTFTIQPLNGKIRDKSTFGRANLDAYFGLGWDKWFCGGKRRIAVSLAFEASQWFQINQWLDLDFTTFNNVNLTSDTSVMAEKRHGDLSFAGGTLHFQFDF